MKEGGKIIGKLIRVVDDNTEKIQQEVVVPWHSHLEFELVNEDGELVTCRVVFGSHQIWVGADGYGNQPAHMDEPLQASLDVFHHDMPPIEGDDHPSRGHAMVLVWSDANEEEPDIVSLVEARVVDKQEEG
jgi:hypothetical protein